MLECSWDDSLGPGCRFQVLECSWDELWNQVQQAQDLDHIIAAHEAFLGTVISRCLLDADSRVRRPARPITAWVGVCVCWGSGAEAGAGVRRGECAGARPPPGPGSLPEGRGPLTPIQPQAARERALRACSSVGGAGGSLTSGPGCSQDRPSVRITPCC